MTGNPRTKVGDWIGASVVLVVGLACALCGITWGLPNADRVNLLGDDLDAVRAQIQPDSRTDTLVYAHEKEADSVDLGRAYRRYFLYSNHPDEMLTLMGLARMKPSSLELHPGQFQYGGLFTYPIGALIFLGGKLELVEVARDVKAYLEQPRAFGRLYVVGRLYVAAFYVATGLLVFWFGRRFAEPSLAVTGAILYLLSPGAIVFAHEMKPHAAAPFFILISFYFLHRLLTENRSRYLHLAAVSCGAATAMVYSNEIFILAVLSCVWFVEGISLTDRLLRTCACCLVVAAVYFAFNPYVLLDFPTLLEEIRLIRIRYQTGISLAGIAGFVRHPLLGSLGVPTALLALWGIIGIVRRRSAWGYVTLGMMVLYATLLIYQLGPQAHSTKMARLMCALFPLFSVLAVAGLNAVSLRWLRLTVGIVSMFWLAIVAWPNLRNYSLDAGAESTRLRAGEWINQYIPHGARVLVPNSPAPYKCPPFAFGRYTLVTQSDKPHDYCVTIGTEITDPSYAIAASARSSVRETPLSFANQPVYIYRRIGK